ncbi:undecaprenyldiphospho-muramoylpentapeptide beta-N-acetylglucosaminyltransferase [Roseomonas sp. SSH11]|uniref:UDP-N-acetylglucosamine--N-acetylmuramyl-(pentapeptide) pyrophosphoryl-undecaprenol N-acetylglucosamine transferase n=1 Tax=Pararoseomonas baculiformis TaxID=2820812 RepID=A0ABS4AFH4_9PROT|nr:undecaprenyldiphospho-muramoylpentapeptide beta-N-acetylglucosaminyltransferase [Pararoseomonas baculiformis]
MRGAEPRPIVIAAGGTGGHFFPAEALAAELTRRGERVALMTDARSSAYASPVFAHAERFVLKGSGLAGHGMLGAARGVLALARGAMEARRLLSDIRPSAVVGFGGYPSVPPLVAARLLPAARRPVVVLHEQNAVLGRANRALARGADLLALCFSGTGRVPGGVRAEVLGNPVRPAITALHGQGYEPPDQVMRILVLGGSLGARIFADVVPPAIALLEPELRRRIQVVQQCRKEDLDRTRAAYAAAGVRAELAPFFSDVEALYRAAHLVIARAGASTVAEIACAGRPSILVPLPHAIDDHQTENARSLSASGAAELMFQGSFTAESLAAALKNRLNAPETLDEAARAAALLGRPDAAARLADRVLSLVAEMPQQSSLGKAA